MSTSPASQKAVEKPKTMSTSTKTTSTVEGRKTASKIRGGGVRETVTTVGRSWFSKGRRNVVINSMHVPQDPFPFLDLDCKSVL